MKKSIWLGILCSVLGSLALGAPLDEEFDGTQINPANWQAWEPFSDSRVRQTNGVLRIQNGGHLLSVESLAEPYEVTGRFRFTGNPRDVFIFVIRTSEQTHPNWHELHNGLAVRFNPTSRIRGLQICKRLQIKGTVLKVFTTPLRAVEPRRP